MAVQFSLSYDEKGDPVLVENTVTGTRKVVSTSPVVSEFKSRFETPDDNIPDEEEDVVDSPIIDYINEMESGAANDINLSFIEKQNLERYTPEAIKARETPLTKMQELVKKGFELVAPANIKAGLAILKVVEGFLPKESPEIKAVKEFYADPEIAKLVEDIPGMSNYNIVYGGFPGISEAGYGLAGAAARRQSVIDKTLANKYGLTPEEIAQTKLGTYKGPVTSDLIDRNKKLQDLQDKENKGIDEKLGIDVQKNIVSMPSGMGSIGSGGGGRDSGNQGGGSPPGTGSGGGGSPAQQAATRSKDLTGGPGKDYGPFSR